MLFNTTEFAVFFAVVLFLYYSPFLQKQQIKLLIVASFIFYSWHQPQWCLLLIFSVVLNAIASWQISNSSNKAFRIACASYCVATNLLILFAFKYAALVASAAGKVIHFPDLLTAIANVSLPVGISFYTFEGISLLVDSLKSSNDENQTDKNNSSKSSHGNLDAEPENHPEKSSEDLNTPITNRYAEHLQKTALFFSFFPHLAAGPIVRPHQFFPQIGAKQFRDIDCGFVLETLITGYFFKNVIADNLVVHTSGVLADSATFSTANNVAALLGYSARIFSDFAGYSLIAMGLAAALGYRLPENFNFPYRSQSLAEFWTRWHITLSTWIRDYLYIPLGGNQKGKLRTYFNLLTVMFLGGLWHGGKIGFAVWGLYHGVLLCIERAFGLNHRNSKHRWLAIVRVLLTFAVVTIGWLLFALPLHEVPHYLRAMIENRDWTPQSQHIILVATFCLPVIAWHLINLANEKHNKLPGKSLTLAAMLVLILTDSGVPQDFVYFQF